ncbi:MAG: HAMP domain-containing sensor histidine kinase [Candidatus Promineifilaceae bacterium]|nr:HAMP domain-containing sensor histidine kinase [Candidatus Promineifilaceae bacterium]
MSRRLLLPLLFLLGPMLLGLLLSLVLNAAPAANPTLVVRISISVVAVLAGLLLSLVASAVAIPWLLRRHYEGELAREQAEAMEDHRRFLRRLDHELKNPLMAIRAALANASNAPAGEARGAALASVEVQAVRLSQLTSDLRKVAELESRPLEREAVQMETLLGEVVALARERPEAESRRLLLSVPRAPWPLPTLAADWDLLFLAVYNLLENALKYSRPEDTIEVRAREDGGAVVVEVADTGPGIVAADLPHVWEELYRGAGARAIAGSGLGLPLVRAVVERHGGAVDLQSRSGQGTVFSLRIPIVEAPSGPS